MVVATTSATMLTQLITTPPNPCTRFGSLLEAQHVPEPLSPEHGRYGFRHPRGGAEIRLCLVFTSLSCVKHRNVAGKAWNITLDTSTRGLDQQRGRQQDPAIPTGGAQRGAGQLTQPTSQTHPADITAASRSDIYACCR